MTSSWWNAGECHCFPLQEQLCNPWARKLLRHQLPNRVIKVLERMEKTSCDSTCESMACSLVWCLDAAPLTPYRLCASYKKSSMSSKRYCTWPLSIWKRHSIVYQAMRSGRLFAYLALTSGSWASYWIFQEQSACWWQPQWRVQYESGSFVQDAHGNTCTQIIRARFLSLARSKLRLCSANHRPGYCPANMSCDWPSTAWAYSEQETENGPWSSTLNRWRKCKRCWSTGILA